MITTAKDDNYTLYFTIGCINYDETKGVSSSMTAFDGVEGVHAVEHHATWARKPSGP
jgi:hypothetical protein